MSRILPHGKLRRHRYVEFHHGQQSLVRAQPLDQLASVNTQYFSQAHDIAESQIRLPTLDTSDKRPVKSRALRKPLLRETERQSTGTDTLTENERCCGVGRRVRHEPTPSGSGLHNQRPHVLVI